MFRPEVLIVATAACLATGCFSTLPMSDSHAQQGERKIFDWLSQEPLIETFPVNYDKVVKTSGGILPPSADITGSYTLTMLRNVATVQEATGKPIREKYRLHKILTISDHAYSESGDGSSISDIADMRSNSAFSGTINFPALRHGENQSQSPFSGILSEKIDLSGSIAFLNMASTVNAETEAGYISIRHMESGSLLGLNIPGLPILPAKPLRIGEQWEVTGFTEQNTKYRYPGDTPPASLAAATLVLMTYQFNGYTDCRGKTCAYLEFFGETYEMRDFGGKSSLPALKAVAKTLSRSPISEVRTYLARRSYSSAPGMKGAFQASAKLAGYCLIDAASRKLVLAKTGKEGLSGGGSGTGPIQGMGKGVFREQWILEEKAE